MTFQKMRFRRKDSRPQAMRSLTLSLKDAYNTVNKAYALSKEEMIDKQALDLLIDQSSVFIEQAREYSKSL